jgi:MYXO-CTERM domain-containing protein
LNIFHWTPWRPFADILYLNALPFAGEIDAVLPSAEFPTGAGTFALNTNLSQVINTQDLPVATPDTLVVSVSITSAVPEPASLTLAGVVAAGLVGYAWRRRR